MSNTDSRTTHTDALDTLGTIIGPNEKRDAIHLAVEPVTAGETLMPGDHVVLQDGKAFRAIARGEGLGIVDPFLQTMVERDQKFWLVIYPRKITSLRHVWEHPELPSEQQSDLTTPIASTTSAKEEAERWIREWCKSDYYDGPSFETLMLNAIQYCNTGETDNYLFIGGDDAHGSIDPEFWKHFKVLTGLSPSFDPPEYFSCSC